MRSNIQVASSLEEEVDRMNIGAGPASGVARRQQSQFDDDPVSPQNNMQRTRELPVNNRR